MATNKYNNIKNYYKNIKFDSIKEKNRYIELELLLKAGIIQNLELQPKYEIIPAIKENGKTIQRATYYIGDFRYIENGKLIVEDVKGKLTDVYKIKKKLMKYVHDIDIKEV